MYRSQPSIRRSILAIALLSQCIGLLVVIAWIFNIELILHLGMGGVTMKFNTGILFFLSGLFLLISMLRSSKWRIVNIGISLLILLLSSLQISQYLFKVDLGIDNMFWEDTITTYLPGRMSFATGLCFILFGLSSFGLYFKINKYVVHTIETMVLIILTLSLFAIFGFVLDVLSETKFQLIESMSPHTSILFFLIGIALSLRNSKIGSMGYFFGRLSGNTVVRWMIPLVIVFPLALGTILIHLVNNHQVNMELGIVICCITCAIVLSGYVVFIASRVNKFERETARLNKTISDSNQELIHFKHALDASSIVAITNSKGIITYANDKFCEISQYTREELIGKTHRIINSGYHSKEFFAKLWSKISNGEVWIGGIKNKAKDGTYYWVHTVIVPFKNSKGEISQYLAIRQDITKLRTLSTQYETLKSRSKELEQFTYIASHDLQEPLNTISSVVEILNEFHSDSMHSEAQELIQFIGNSAERMSTLIHGLLDYSLIGKSRQLVNTNCNDILANVLDDLKCKIQSSNCTIETEDLPNIGVYKSEFYTLLLNIISNSIKFCKTDIPPKIKITCRLNGTNWQFSIKDNGIGIEEHQIHKIFGMFQRLHNRNDEYEGTGIGLAHCEKIVDLHGGQLWVDSTPGNGSIFNFTIPANLK